MADMKMTTFLLDATLKRRMRIAAARRGLTMTAFLRQLVSDAMAQEPFFDQPAQTNTQNANSTIQAAPEAHPAGR